LCVPLTIFSGSIRLTEVDGDSLPPPDGASVKGDGNLVDDATGCTTGSWLIHPKICDGGFEGPCVGGCNIVPSVGMLAKYCTFEGANDIVGRKVKVDG
jgi:hypothetical protein